MTCWPCRSASPRLMLADKGYDGDDVPRRPAACAAFCRSSRPRPTAKSPSACDFRPTRIATAIERMFNRLKQFRRIATRYDKTALSFLGFLNLAASRLWLKAFVNRA